MRKILTSLLVLILVLTMAPMTFAEIPANAGPSAFELETELSVQTTIVPMSLTVFAGEAVQFVATTTYVSNKGENQLLHFVSDQWRGVDQALSAQLSEIEADPAAASNERQKVFIATADVIVSDEPGEYDVAVTYSITLQHDHSGKRIYTSTASQVVTITVLAGDPLHAEEGDAAGPTGEALNHGQIVSAWAHWKQTKGNKNFLKGGPGVYRSLVWYKTQVEYGTFYSQQEVWDHLESIYEPAPRENGHPNKSNNGRPNKDGNGNPGNNGNNGNPGKGK